MNRKSRRKILFGDCSCGSGKKFYRCHLLIERQRQEQLRKQAVKKQLESMTKEHKDV